MTFKNISSYKSHKSKLLSLIYSSELTSIGKIIFKHGQFKGVIARLWKDEISIDFDEEFISKFPEIIKQSLGILKEIEIIENVRFDFNRIKFHPIDKDRFEDTKSEMRKIAKVYVLTLDICLTKYSFIN